MENKILKIGLFSAGGKFKIENGFLSYHSPYANKNWRVNISDIATVSLAPAGPGKFLLKIIGQGTDLASMTLPFTWASKCQGWILDNK